MSCLVALLDTYRCWVYVLENVKVYGWNNYQQAVCLCLFVGGRDSEACSHKLTLRLGIDHMYRLLVGASLAMSIGGLLDSYCPLNQDYPSFFSSHMHEMDT